MEIFASGVGFKIVKEKTLFKTFRVGKRNYSTYNLTRKIPLWFTNVLDLLLPSLFFKADYNIVILKK